MPKRSAIGSIYLKSPTARRARGVAFRRSAFCLLQYLCLVSFIAGLMILLRQVSL